MPRCLYSALRAEENRMVGRVERLCAIGDNEGARERFFEEIDPSAYVAPGLSPLALAPSASPKPPKPENVVPFPTKVGTKKPAAKAKKAKGTARHQPAYNWPEPVGLSARARRAKKKAARAAKKAERKAKRARAGAKRERLEAKLARIAA